jgi:transposase
LVLIWQKNLVQLNDSDRHGKAVWRRRLTRDKWLKVLLAKVEPGCEIGMEAGAGAHHWACQLQARGVAVKLIAPKFVKPYVKSNKDDAKDAEPVCEALSRPSMRFVAIKTVEQQDIQAAHRIRSELIGPARPMPTHLKQGSKLNQRGSVSTIARVL